MRVCAQGADAPQARSAQLRRVGRRVARWTAILLGVVMTLSAFWVATADLAGLPGGRDLTGKTIEVDCGAEAATLPPSIRDVWSALDLRARKDDAELSGRGKVAATEEKREEFSAGGSYDDVRLRVRWRGCRGDG